MIFIKQFSNFRKVFHFVLFHSIFLCCLCYYCSINVERQSELLGLRSDTSSLVCFSDLFLQNIFFGSSNSDNFFQCYLFCFMKIDLISFSFCSDFRNESNGIFVLGVGFFLQTNFDFLTSHFWRNFFISFKRYCCPELKFEKIFHL